MRRMYFAQLRRACWALAGYVGIVGLLLVVSIWNKNVRWFDSTYVHVDYRVPHSQSPTQDLVLWRFESYYNTREPHWLLPWQAPHESAFKPPRPITRDQTGFVNRVVANTETGRFVGYYRSPAQHITYYPDGKITGRLPQTLTVVGPSGEQLAWRRVSGPAAWVYGFDALTFLDAMPWVVLFGSLFALLLSAGVGGGLADYLGRLRTDPAASSRFVVGAFTIDLSTITIAVAITIAPVSFIQLSDTNLVSTILTSNLGALTLLVCWLVAISSYAIGVTITLSRRRAIALGWLAVVAVILVIVGLPGSVLPGPAEIVRPMIDALDPVHHYFTFLQAFYFQDVRYSYWATQSVMNQHGWIRNDLAALVGTVAAALLVAALRWRLVDLS